MAYWNGNEIKYFKPQKCEDYTTWEIIDCGCCSGIEWGGEYPRECSCCKGNGFIYHHLKSGALALYPGGPFIGKIAI